MIMYDWVDCSKEEYDKHWMEGGYRRIPIYPEEISGQGIVFFINEQPKPIGYKYQKGINPKYGIVCKSITDIQTLEQAFEKPKNNSFWYNKEEQD